MSDGDKKRIFINPKLFSLDNVSRKKTKPEKVLRIKNDKPVSDKTRKNQILKRIRENQEKQYNSLFDGEKIKVDIPKKTNEETAFESDFDKSLSFMSHVADSKPKQIAHNRTFKHANNNNNFNDDNDCGVDNALVSSVAVDLPIDFFLPATITETSAIPMSFAKPPEFGCMKNGNLPTRKSLHNTTMKLSQTGPTIVGSLQTAEEKQEKQEKLELMRKLHQQQKDAEKPKPQIVQRKVKKLLRRTFNLGKDRFRPRVGVLLPNRTIRNNVTTKSFMIKQKPIAEIRKFLLNQGFIKVGSTAPTDVLRKIYESIVMIDGDVKNHNPDNLLYNFFKGTEKH